MAVTYRVRCYGNMQMLTSPPDPLWCLTVIQHALVLSDTREPLANDTAHSIDTPPNRRNSERVTVVVVLPSDTVWTRGSTTLSDIARQHQTYHKAWQCYDNVVSPMQ